MSHTATVSRAAWIALAVSAVFAGAAWFVRLHWRSVAPTVDAEFVALTAEREQLRGNEDQVRDSLRKQRDGVRRQAWTAGALATLRAEIGAEWQWRWETVERATLVHLAPQLEQWPAYVGSVAALGAKPGVIVESVEVCAEGAARNRRFTAVRLGLRFILADAPTGDAERAAPSRGPLPVAPAEGSAAPRKVGPGTPLHRPAASAEPPAAGPASASFRPDPPGPWAGVSTKTMNPQENQK